MAIKHWASKVSKMTEDGDMKGAVGLAASNKMNVPYYQATVFALDS
jgi:hypothetical protein